MTEPTVAEIAWCAGLFEGEGNIGSIHKPGPRHVGGRIEPRMQIRMTDEDVLIEFQRILGGRLTGPHLQGPADSSRYKVEPKPFWIWVVSSWDEFKRIGDLIRPWLKSRRAARYDFCIARMPNRFRKAHASMPCDYAPTVSIAGYLKHRRRGERACEVCLESYRLYQRDYLPKWRAARAQKLTPN